jgi:hypothetical protein
MRRVGGCRQLFCGGENDGDAGFSKRVDLIEGTVRKKKGTSLQVFHTQPYRGFGVPAPSEGG